MRPKITSLAVIVFLVLLTLVVGAGNLWASYDQFSAYKAGQEQTQAAQGRQGRQIEAKLCTTLASLAALKPPPGNPASNPSRAFDARLHDKLAQLGPDIGCPEGTK